MKKKVENGKKMRRCRGGGFIYSGKQLVAFIVAVALTSNLVNVNASVSDNLNTAVISVLTKISDFVSGIDSSTSGVKDNTKTIGDNTGDLASTLASMDEKLGDLVSSNNSSGGNKDITFIANANGKVIDSGGLSAYSDNNLSKTLTSTTGGYVYVQPIGDSTVWVSVDGKPRVPCTVFDSISGGNNVAVKINYESTLTVSVDQSNSSMYTIHGFYYVCYAY